MPTVNDPKGYPQSVDLEGFAFTRGFTHSRFYHVATVDGFGYVWYSGRRDIDATDTMLFVKNLSSKNLIMDELLINGSNVICNWEIARGSATTTPVGSAVTGVNWNGSKATVQANVVALYDETGVAQGSVLFDYWTGVTSSETIDLEGLLLPQNHYIQVDQVTESTSGSVILKGHFD